MNHPDRPWPSDEMAAQSRRHPRSSRTAKRAVLFFVGLLLGGLAAWGVWVVKARQRDSAEEAARLKVSDVGAINIRDASQKHAKSVVMTTFESCDKLDAVLVVESIVPNAARWRSAYNCSRRTDGG